MESNRAVKILSALAQEHRLGLVRLLIQSGGQGMSAGALADAMGLPNSSLSFHLAQLMHAGLIAQERRSRSLIYRADYDAMNGLVAYLMENCCGGNECGAETACTMPDEERSAA